MLSSLLRVVGVLVGLVVAVSIALAIAHASWMSSYRRELEVGSRIARTGRGAIEYAIAGEGIPLLLAHGRPGGYDQMIAGPRARPEEFAGFRVIAVSRPGYLRTPLDSGRTPAEQADLYAALLDEIRIERAVVLGASGGGPSALQFALRHPGRTLGLVLLAPLLASKPDLARQRERGTTGRILQDFGVWVAGPLLAMQVGSRMAREFDARDPLHVARMQETLESLLAADLRSAGSANDKLHFKDLGIEAWPLEQVAAPTLILHGTADTNTPYEGSVRAAARLPNAELVTFEDGDHLVLVTRGSEIQERIRRFASALARP